MEDQKRSCEVRWEGICGGEGTETEGCEEGRGGHSFFLFLLMFFDDVDDDEREGRKYLIRNRKVWIGKYKRKKQTTSIRSRLGF